MCLEITEPFYSYWKGRYQQSTGIEFNRETRLAYFAR